MFKNPHIFFDKTELIPTFPITELTYKNADRPLTLNELEHVNYAIVIHAFGFSK
jgi:hypothetical protein